MAKRSVPKRAMKKAKRALANRKKRMAKKNMDTFFLRTKVTAAIVPSQGVTVANYISSFWKLLDATSAVGVTQSSEFGMYCKIYDRVRVNRLRVRVVPKANVLDMSAAQNDAALNLIGDGKVHTAIYREADGFNTTVTRFQRQPSYKAYSLLKPFTRSYGIKYPTGVWLDAQNIYNDTTLLQRLGALGGIGIYAENILEDNLEVFNEPWAAIELSYDCVFQGKTVTALSQDASGNILLSNPVNLVVAAPSKLINIAGTFGDTRATGYDPTTGEIVEVSRTDTDAP